MHACPPICKPHACEPTTQDVTKNYSQTEAAAQLRTLLPLPWTSASLQTESGQVSVQTTRRGRALVQRTGRGSSSDPSGSSAADAQSSDAARQAPRPPLRHDRRKALLIPGDVPDPFLQKIGLQTEDGRIRANMQVRSMTVGAWMCGGVTLSLSVVTQHSTTADETQLHALMAELHHHMFTLAPKQDKFVQINKFVELLVHTGELDGLLAGRGAASPGDSAAAAGGDDDTGLSSSGGSSSSSSADDAVWLLDCGCGSAHLTFGAFHYLSNLKGARVGLMGVDTNAALMERSNRCGCFFWGGGARVV
jgi:hypothetical protein